MTTKQVILILAALSTLTSCRTRQDRWSHPAELKDTGDNQWREVEPFALSNSILNNSSVPFISHAAQSYLAMNVRFQPIKQLYPQIEQRLRITLKNRGEAHITIVSPVEYDSSLKGKLTMEEIDHIAFKRKLQNSHFEIVCLGKGEVGDDQTFYLVVKSEELLQVRKDIADLVEKKHGSTFGFDPLLYFPHITVGFTDKDLHYEQGVIKDERSCIAPLDFF